ncbi:MAG: hypothetical protein ACLFWF_03370 [Alphaproteobacteria bacterium]
MNRLLTMAAGLLVLAALAYWYYDQTERRQRSAEAMQAGLAEFLTSQGARYGTLTYDRGSNSVTVTDVAWTQEAGGMSRRMTLERAEIVAGDIEAFRTVFRPTSYAPGDARVGDFLKLAAAIDLRGLEMRHAGGTVSLSRFHMESPAMRQFGFPPSRQGIEDAGAAFVAGDIGSALKFRKGRFEELRLSRGEDEEISLATLELGSFDSGKLDQLAAKGFAAQTDGVKTSLEGLAVNNLGLEHWLDGLKNGALTLSEGGLAAGAWANGRGPAFDGVKIVGFKLAGEEAGRLSVDEASLTDLVRVGDLVAAGNLRISGLEYPVRGDAPWSRALSEMGYEKLRLNLVSRSTYDPGSKVSETTEFMVEVENAGRIFGSSRLENVEIGDELRELDLKGFVSDGGLERMLGTWRLARLEVGYKDLSLIGRAYELALKRLGKPPEVLTAEYIAQLEALRERHGNGPFLTRLSEQMKIFLEEPNAIVFRMVPPEPVVLAQIALAGFDDPEELAKMLGLTVEAKPAK